MKMQRENLIDLLAAETAGLVRPHPVRVAVDGIDAAGKTILADELGRRLEEMDRSVIRASIDGFHHPREIRYQRGKDSAEGYYRDSFDYEAVKKVLLEPLGPDGKLTYQKAVFDHQENRPINMDFQKARSDAILLFDGVFLLRPEMYAYWDIKIFVDIEFDESTARAIKRDVPLLGNEELVRERYKKRYIPGQMLYFVESSPKEKADFIVKNDKVSNPEIIKKSG
ncbi:MAG: uridine kinase [Chloroflexota bacterium]